MANSFLKDLSEQPDRRIVIKKQNRVKGPLLTHRKNRRSALSLHRSVIHGNCWKRSCKDNHHVGFLLSSPWLQPVRASKSSSCPKFRMIITSEIAADLQPCIQNFEIEAESKYLESNIGAPQNPLRQLQESSLVRKEVRVKIVVDKGREEDYGSIPTEGSFPVPPIADVCFALSSISNPKKRAVLLGYLPDGSHRHPNICPDKHHNALIRSEMLVPLGLVLVELSLCQTIKSLRIPEDNDAIKSYADLKTAARVLTQVELQSGLDYATVVDSVFFWPGTKSSTMDDKRMQSEMYQEIVVPLIESLRRFEGIA